MNNHIKYICLILFSVLFISGCSNSAAQTDEALADGGYRLYYLDSGENQLVTERYIPTAATQTELIDEFIVALDKSPDNFAYIKAKPMDIQIVDDSLDDDGLLILYFNSAYSNLKGTKEVLCRAAIVKTFCQIEGVDYVEFYVNGQPLIVAGEVLVGRMRGSDFIDNTGESGEYVQEANIKVYFANSTGDMLLESLLIVRNNGLVPLEQLVVEQLISGPLDEQTDMLPVMPDGTKLNSISTKDGVCYVDFNESFLELREGINANVAIYSVVNSLVELPHINKVQFYINGEIRRTFLDIDFSSLFERNLDLMVSEKAGESQ